MVINIESNILFDIRLESQTSTKTQLVVAKFEESHHGHCFGYYACGCSTYNINRMELSSKCVWIYWKDKKN